MRVISTTAKQCLEFIPIARSAVYLDITVAPEPASKTITLAPFASVLVTNSSRIAIYALNSNDIYDTTNFVWIVLRRLGHYRILFLSQSVSGQ